MAGLMGFPVGHRGNLSNVDVNNMKESGLYYLGTGNTNADAYSYLIVQNAGYNCLQQMIDHEAKSVKIRVLHNGTWSTWIRIDNFGYNNLDELAAALKPLI